jgi:CO/xanthine dehydrogenase Mo-binding subunit
VTAGRVGFGTDGVVTVATGKVEYGQGIWTALAQIAAEELGVRPARVVIAEVSTAASPDEGTTSGSRSVEDSGAALRRACAQARRAFVVAAGAVLGTGAAALAIDDGEITTAAGRTGLTYWSLGRRAGRSAVAVGADGTAGEPPGTTGAPGADQAAGARGADQAAGARGADQAAGARGADQAAEALAVSARGPGRQAAAGGGLPRLDIPDKVTGRPRFIHDLVLPGMLFGRVVRPPAAAAELQSAGHPDLPAGVFAVVADGSFLGVVAETDTIARAAAWRLGRAARWKVRESLPDENDLKGFLLGEPAETSPVVRRRDAAAAARVTRTLAAEYSRPFLAHASLAPSCAVARADGAAVTVWTHSQGIFGLRGALAAGLGIEPGDVTVRYAEGAGMYGHNGADDAALDAVLLARVPACRGRPVRVQWSREDEMAWAPFGPAMLARLSAGLGPDGRIQTWRQDVWSNGFLGRPGTGGEPRLLALAHLASGAGAHAGQSLPAALDGPPVPVTGSARNSAPGYDIPDLDVTRHRLLTMPVRTSSLRSLGAFLNVFAIESFMDELAAAAGADPVAFRLAHLSDPRGRRVLSQAAGLAGWPGRPRGDGTGFGVGYARYKGTSGYCAAVAQVHAGTEIRVRRLWLAVDVGRVVSPDGVINQAEGGAVQSASWALRERVRFDRTRITSVNWDSYPILRFSEVPDVTVRVIETPGEPESGAGEVAQGPVAGAIGNAVADAVGARVRDLPLTREQVIAAIERG